MIKRIVTAAVVAALALSLSCNFAVKHPAATAGIVAGSVALTTCELASEDHKNCFIAAGAVGAGLWLLAAVALWFGTEDEPATTTTSEPPPQVDWSKVPDTTPKEPTKAPPAAPTTSPPTPPPPPAPPPATTPPPPPVDAGVPQAPGDAGAPASDASR